MQAILALVPVLLLFTSCAVDSARILGIFPLPGRSHYILASSLMRALAEKGHDVTVISPFGEKDPPKGGSYRDVVLTDMLKFIKETENKLNFFEMVDMGVFVNIPFLAYLMSELGEWTLRDGNVQELIKSGEKFDAVIVEQFYNDAHKSLATHFEGVQIVFSAMAANFFINNLVANPSPPSYVPDIFLSYQPHMTFCERLTNTLAYLLNTLVHQFYLYPKHNSVAQKYVPNAPHINDLLYNASLILVNSHPSINQPIPHVPNMVDIGGFHIKPPKKLPQDLQDFLDNAKDGVIYFSMGSNLKSAELPPEKRDAIVRTFGKLKQQVLWKWEDEVLPGQPGNVKLEKWLPQQSILAHPNLKLFITHGGLLSTTETIYFGVPILAIPVYGDQQLNAQTAASSGYGLYLPFKELSEEALTQNIAEILNNPKYAANAKSKSKVFHDRLVKPMDEATYWVDYVIRHKGAPHLRVAGVDLPWYKYFLVDVIASIVVMSVIGIGMTYFVLRKICQKLFSKKKTKKEKKN